MSEESELDRYRVLRRAGISLNTKLVKQLKKQAIKSCAKKLGLWVDNSVVLHTEEEMPILLDYALHNYRDQGQTAVELYLAQAPTDLDPDERLVLEARAKSRYTIVMVNNVVANLGINAQDIFYRDSLFLTDQSASLSSYPGLLLATRLVSLPGFVVTSGAALPLAPQLLPRVVDFMGRNFGDQPVGELSLEDQSRLETIVILVALSGGASQNIRYE
jgi:hypothetical protein